MNPGDKQGTGIVLVYMTASNKDEARCIGKLLVEEKLAACVNIVDGMESFYWWEGKVDEGSEAILIAKTRRSLVGRLISSVKSAHSYSCPCILTYSIEDGNPDYIRWLGDCVKD